MTDAEKLAIYDKLRDMHHMLNDISGDYGDDGSAEQTAIFAVDNVLYLAELVFARMSD